MSLLSAVSTRVNFGILFALWKWKNDKVYFSLAQGQKCEVPMENWGNDSAVLIA